jgi:molybdenum cofactor cytidylyltransferase
MLCAKAGKSGTVIAAVVLAAGESRRMGFPKAALPYRNSTFLQATVAACDAAGLSPVVVVVSSSIRKALNGIQLANFVVAINDTPQTGQIGSLKKGLGLLLNRPVDAAVVWPVDHPRVRIATVQQMLEAYRESRAPIVIPTYQGKRGHPVLFARSLFEELLAAPADLGARAVVRADRGRVAEVPVEDPAILEDIDTPDAYENLIRASGLPPVEPPE